MLPGRSTNITRELKLNRLVDENVELYRDKFDLSVHIPLPIDFSKMIEYNYDEKFIEFSQREYNTNFCKNILQHIAKNVITKNILLNQ